MLLSDSSSSAQAGNSLFYTDGTGMLYVANLNGSGSKQASVTTTPPSLSTPTQYPHTPLLLTPTQVRQFAAVSAFTAAAPPNAQQVEATSLNGTGRCDASMTFGADTLAAPLPFALHQPTSPFTALPTPTAYTTHSGGAYYLAAPPPPRGASPTAQRSASTSIADLTLSPQLSAISASGLHPFVSTAVAAEKTNSIFLTGLSSAGEGTTQPFPNGQSSPSLLFAPHPSREGFITFPVQSAAGPFLQPQTHSPPAKPTRVNGVRYTFGALYEGRVKRYNPQRGFGFLTASHQLIPLSPSPSASSAAVARLPDCVGRPYCLHAHDVVTIGNGKFHRVPVNLGDIFVHLQKLTLSEDPQTAALMAAALTSGTRVRFTTDACDDQQNYQAVNVVLLPKDGQLVDLTGGPSPLLACNYPCNHGISVYTSENRGATAQTATQPWDKA